MVGTSDTISTNGTVFNSGDTLSVTITTTKRTGGVKGTLYIGETEIPVSSSSLEYVYDYVLTDTGTFNVHFINNMYSLDSNNITITVNAISNVVSAFVNRLKSVFVQKSNINGLLKNDGTIDTNTYLTQHQDITGKEDKSNKVTSISSSSTDTEYPSAKAVFDSLSSVPSASSVTPSADTTNGSVGNGTTWARSNHTHPKSSLYAEASHTHSLDTLRYGNDFNNGWESISLFTQDNDYKTVDMGGLITLDYSNNQQKATYKTLREYEKSDDEIATIDDIDYTIDNYDFGLGDLAYLDDISGNITSENIDGYVGTVALSNDYDDLDNKPSIPVNTSDLNNDSGFLTSHQDITGKEDKSNKVTSLSSSSTDTEYPSAKLVYDIINNISIENTDLFDVLQCVIDNFDNFPLWDIVFNIDNYNGLPSKICIVANNELRNNAVSQISLNKEFTLSTNYTLEFDYYTSAGNRNGFYFGADPSLEDGVDIRASNDGLQVLVDIGNTLVETFNGTSSSATNVYTHTSNLLTSGTHHIRIVRDGANATFYIDDIELYTYTNAKYNTIGLNKWGGGYNTISNIEIKIGD